MLYAGTQVASGAISGNLASGVLAAFGPSLTTTALDKVGLNSEVLDRLGVNQDDLVAGLVKTQTALAQQIYQPHGCRSRRLCKCWWGYTA